MAKKKIEHHVTEEHHHWHMDEILKTLVIFAIVLLLVNQAFSMISTEAKKHETVYKTCMDACEDTRNCNWKAETCRITGVDNTPCITSCNILYANLRSK